MADDAGPDPDDNGADRGRLTLKDRVAERIATKAALNTPGVRTHSGTVDRMRGRELPRTEVNIAGDRIRAAVDIAVAWSTPLPAVALAVHGNVTTALTDMAGLRVDGVTVHVARVVTADAATERTLQ